MNKKHITDLKSALRIVLVDLLFSAVSCHVNIVLQNLKNLISVSENHVNFLNGELLGVYGRSTGGA